MSFLEAYRILNAFCFAGIVIVAYLLWFNRKSVKNIQEALLFLGCLMCHLILTGYLNLGYGPIFWTAIGGASLIPFASWVVVRSVTDAPTLKTRNLLLLTTTVLCCNYALDIWDRYSGPMYPDIMLRLISLGFMGHALLMIFRSEPIKKDIWVNKERRTFLLGVIAIIVISLMSELALRKHQLIYLFVLQRISMIGLTIYFLATTFTPKEGIVSKKRLGLTPKDPKLADKINDAVIFEKLFLLEGLTIAKLSEIIDEKEYKVRHAIIHDLGFKNFTDFINSFRVSEASKMLTEPGKEGLSILEIAFQVGFSSIGPFNRAFKAFTGVTPSQYRSTESDPESNLIVA